MIFDILKNILNFCEKEIKNYLFS